MLDFVCIMWGSGVYWIRRMVELSNDISYSESFIEKVHRLWGMFLDITLCILDFFLETKNIAGFWIQILESYFITRLLQ